MWLQDDLLEVIKDDLLREKCCVTRAFFPLLKMGFCRHVAFCRRGKQPAKNQESFLLCGLLAWTDCKESVWLGFATSLVLRGRFSLSRCQAQGEDRARGRAGLGNSFTHPSKSDGRPAPLLLCCCSLDFTCYRCFRGCAVNRISNWSRLKYLPPTSFLAPPPSQPPAQLGGGP